MNVLIKVATRVLLAITVVALSQACDSGEGSSSDNVGNSTGHGGSTARMTIDGDYLYAIAGSRVQLFDISVPATPNTWARVNVAWDIETLFPYGDYLLIGASSGMHIMDNTDPANPQYIADFRHARARDPVVAHEGYAYVTLKSDSFGGTDQMDVIDIQDIYNPRLVQSINMQGPGGLSVSVRENSDQSVNENLYVCDDIAGLKIFDLTNRESPTVVSSIPDVNCNDVIADRGILYVITDNSLLQYDYLQTPAVLISSIVEQ